MIVRIDRPQCNEVVLHLRYIYGKKLLLILDGLLGFVNLPHFACIKKKRIHCWQMTMDLLCVKGKVLVIIPLPQLK